MTRIETLFQRYNRLRREPNDISEHLPLLLRYGLRSDSIVEFGVRGGNSTTALLHAVNRNYVFLGRRARLRSIDINPCPVAGELAALVSSKIAFTFEQADTLKLPPIDSCDLLFIDTLHTYEQLSAELARHAEGVKRWILLHDTTTFGDVGEGGGPGLWPAVEEFLTASGGRWRLLERLTNQNGLTVLERVTI